MRLWFLPAYVLVHFSYAPNCSPIDGSSDGGCGSH
jgi:hypothetical protein